MRNLTNSTSGKRMLMTVGNWFDAGDIIFRQELIWKEHIKNQNS